jgi:predicted PurR-regulated permease PerM
METQTMEDPGTLNGLAAWIRRGVGLAIGVALVFGVLALAYAASSVLLLMLVAVILASGLEPIMAWLRGHLPIGRGAAILLVYGLFLLAVIGIVLVILPSAIGQFEATLRALPLFLDRARGWAGSLQPPALGQALSALVDAAARTIRPPQTAPGGAAVIGLGLSVASALTSVVTLLTVVYFWLTEHARIQRYVLAFVAEPRRPRAHAVWNHAETRLGLWVRGQLILMAAIGIGAGIAYTILGVPSALLLGLIAALAEAIPIVGPLLGAIPAVVVAATVSPQLGLEVAAVYAVLQLVEGSMLVPLVMRNTVLISPFLVIFSVLVGAAVGSFVGALLAVPIAATVVILLEDLQAREVPVAQDRAKASDGEEPAEDDGEAGSKDTDLATNPGSPRRARSQP